MVDPAPHIADKSRRRLDEWQALRELTDRLDWVQLTAVPDESRAANSGRDPVPAAFELTFRGRGVVAGASEHRNWECADTHRLRIELPDRFPEQPPQLQMLSPLFHPNVPSDGHIHLPDIGLQWQPALTLDVICERVWDVIRGAYVDRQSKINLGAWVRYEEASGGALPVDPRRLGDGPTRPKNVVRYRRRGQPPRDPPPRQVMVIDDEPTAAATADRCGQVDANASDSPSGIHFIG